MVSLRSGKKVPFLGKNIPKRSYCYKKPLPTEEESELISKIGSISIHEPSTLPDTSQTNASDININDNTFGSMPSLEGSSIEESEPENFDASGDDTDVESTIQSEIVIDTADSPEESVCVIQKFEAEMTRAEKHFKLMGILNASTKLMGRSNPPLIDYSNASSSSQDSVSSGDLSEDSVSVSDVSSIIEENKTLQQSVFSDISAGSSLSSTLEAMIENAIDSIEDDSSDQDDCNSTRQSRVEAERRPSFSENS